MTLLVVNAAVPRVPNNLHGHNRVVANFTLAASVVTGGGQEGARAALLGAIGANASWAIINAVLYIMDSAFDRNRRLRIVRVIASTPEDRVIAKFGLRSA